MQTARVLACCLLIVLLAGTVSQSVPKSRAKSLQSFGESSAERANLLADLRAGGDLFRAGRYHEAAARFALLAEEAARRRDEFVAARATGDLGGCQFALHQYREALQSFLNARERATGAGDTSAVAAFDANIASLYVEMGDLESAARWIQGARDRLTYAPDRREHLAKIVIQLATIRARQKQFGEARDLFQEGIRLAERSGDLDLYAIGWNRWGEELLEAGNLAEAESALLEAYRVRKLRGQALDTSYRSLGRLRLEQGDLTSAAALLDRAVELSTASGGQVPTWDLYHYRGRVRLAQGRLHEALDDLRTAVRLGRAWRWSAATGDASRIAEEGRLERVHSALIEACNRLYLATGDRAYARESFEAVEENRAASLRVLRAERAVENSAAYWEALARLQRAEVAKLRGANLQAPALADARAEVDRLEAGADRTGLPPGSGMLERFQSSLDTDSVLFSFHLDTSQSWMWAVDRRGMELYPLPGRDAIQSLAAETAAAARDDRAEVESSSTALHNTLFGHVSSRLLAKKHWLLALDGPLFDAPFAALIERRNGRSRYLIEAHSLEAIPGVGWWLDRSREKGFSNLFVGIGDPVYNAADPRTPAAEKSNQGTGPILPRLIGSGVELEACKRAWGGDFALLQGPDASQKALASQLGRNPSIVHFATHILEMPARSGNGVIALSLAKDGRPEFLSPHEIANWRIRVRLVVLSGCDSALGDVRPGTGLLGLTRAWLAAGAEEVIASRWATPDDNGALFSALYRHLRDRPGAGNAEALRDAQLEMLRGSGWRARPRYWGAYLAMGVEDRQ